MCGFEDSLFVGPSVCHGEAPVVDFLLRQCEIRRAHSPIDFQVFPGFARTDQQAARSSGRLQPLASTQAKGWAYVVNVGANAAVGASGGHTSIEGGTDLGGRVLRQVLLGSAGGRIGHRRFVAFPSGRRRIRRRDVPDRPSHPGDKPQDSALLRRRVPSRPTVSRAASGPGSCPGRTRDRTRER